jgi:hypothetical protein
MKKSFSTSSEVLDSLEITNLEAATFLVSGTHVDYLLPFFEKECSLSEAAKERGVSMAKMRYWIDKMEELGLIKHTKTVTRKGSPIKYYFRVADEYKVPLSCIPTESLEELLEQKERRLVKRGYQYMAKAVVNHNCEWYAHYYLENGNPTAKTKPEKGTAEDARVFSYWMMLLLKPEQSRALRSELRDIQVRYAALAIENSEQKAEDAVYSLTHLFSIEER